MSKEIAKKILDDEMSEYTSEHINKEKEPKSETYTLLSNELFTGYNDDNGSKIFIGDKLRSEWGYEVVVVKDEDGDYTGKLICDENHTCKNMPYALNNGNGYTKVFV